MPGTVREVSELAGRDMVIEDPATDDRVLVGCREDTRGDLLRRLSRPFAASCGPYSSPRQRTSGQRRHSSVCTRLDPVRAWPRITNGVTMNAPEGLRVAAVAGTARARPTNWRAASASRRGP